MRYARVMSIVTVVCALWTPAGQAQGRGRSFNMRPGRQVRPQRSAERKLTELQQLGRGETEYYRARS